MASVSGDTRDRKVSGEQVAALRDPIRSGTQVVEAFFGDGKEHRSRKARNLIAGKGKTPELDHWIWGVWRSADTAMKPDPCVEGLLVEQTCLFQEGAHGGEDATSGPSAAQPSVT